MSAVLERSVTPSGEVEYTRTESIPEEEFRRAMAPAEPEDEEAEKEEEEVVGEEIERKPVVIVFPGTPTKRLDEELKRHEQWRKAGGTRFDTRRSDLNLLFGPFPETGPRTYRVRAKSFYEWAKREAPGAVEAYVGGKRRTKKRRKSQRATRMSPLAKTLLGR